MRSEGGRVRRVVAGERAPGRRTRRPARRDRRGRGLRGHLAPTEVPLRRSAAQRFDDLVLDAVEELEDHWAAELSGVEFAVEDVPAQTTALEFEPDVITDRGVALGRLYRNGLPEISGPTIVVYRRPIEARAVDPEDRADLVFMVVVDLTAEFLGRDVDEIDPS